MELLSYLLKVSACTVLFFAFYLLVLRKLTFFKTNRFYLLFTLLLSFAIPALNFTIEREVVVSPMALEPAVFLTDETLTEQHQAIPHMPLLPVVEERFNYRALIPYVYFAVVLSLLVIAIWRILQLLKHTKNSTQKINGLRIVRKAAGFTNCSFFNYVFIDDKLTPDELQVLLKHEEVHAKQLHSVDKVILIVFKSLLWFNPVVYLYDKALEQAHEYEADDVASKTFGNHSYAGLLLKLAVGESQNTLIHNFVKSPVKERIKMLFSSKSKNMKKLAYLLVTPLVLGLIWGFTVEVVEVFPSSNVISVVADKDPILNKTIKGVVDSVSGSGLFSVIHFKVGNTIYLIRNDVNRKVSKGEELTLKISGRMNEMRVLDKKTNREVIYIEKPVYMMSEAFTAKGKSLIKAPEKHPFLYEANKARFTTSKIESIKRNSAGYASEIVLNDGSFKIAFDVAALKTKAENFKIGNEVTAKFIGERLTAKNTYATNKLISLYSASKKDQIVNSALYNKFYSKEGFQIVRGGRPKPLQMTTIPENQVKIVSASETKNYVSRGITNLKNAVLQIGKTKIEAEKVTLDSKNSSLIAEMATIYFSDGKVKKSKVVMYDIKKQAYTFHEFANEDKALNKSSELKMEGVLDIKDISKNFPYIASDSVVLDKILERQILYGNARLELEKYKVEGKRIHVFAKEKDFSVRWFHN